MRLVFFVRLTVAVVVNSIARGVRHRRLARNAIGVLLGPASAQAVDRHGAGPGPALEGDRQVGFVGVSVAVVILAVAIAVVARGAAFRARVHYLPFNA
jgi:hypothetical protein